MQITELIPEHRVRRPRNIPRGAKLPLSPSPSRNSGAGAARSHWDGAERKWRFLRKGGDVGEEDLLLQVLSLILVANQKGPCNEQEFDLPE